LNNSTHKENSTDMPRITDMTTLEGMKGKEIRFFSGKYGGKGKQGSGYGWVDKKTGKHLAVKSWVIVDMSGDGKNLNIRK
jgi:hypothetical protein